MSDLFTIVVPTIGRESLHRLLGALDKAAVRCAAAERPSVVLVDDRPGRPRPLDVQSDLALTVARSGGRGPAAARNVGWRAARSRWVCFLDDDVLPQPDWFDRVVADLRDADAAGAVGSQAVIEVPGPPGRRPTDDERRTLHLAEARWITADMAYLRSVLVAVGGFDDRFPRAYREDADLALRITAAGHTIVRGSRRSTHPVAPATLMSSVRAQIGNRDNALMRRKHGRHWRRLVGEGRGRLPAHALTTAAALATLAGAASRRGRVARGALAAWAGLTAQFAWIRVRPGPRTAGEAARMLITSALIPPVAVAHRVRGAWTFRSARRDPPLAVLLDRDDTIIEDVPYLRDPSRVRPVPGAVDALTRLRQRGLLLAVVSNQSGVAKGLIGVDELAAVNRRVSQVLGTFESWQVCPHDDGDDCGCRKPRPGMVYAAAADLDVPVSRCVLIGDTGADVRAALSAGADAVLVPTARTLEPEIAEARARPGARVADSLPDAVALVLKDCR